MKTLGIVVKGIVVLLASFGAFALCVMLQDHRRVRIGSTHLSVNWDDLPSWFVTNNPPMAIEEAVEVASEHLLTLGYSLAQWKLESLGLIEGVPNKWYYELAVSIKGHDVGWIVLRVFPDGEVGVTRIGGAVIEGGGGGRHRVTSQQ